MCIRDRSIKAKKGSKKSKSFTEQDLKDQIVSEATVKLLIEKVLDTNNKALLESFQNNSISLHTDDFNALRVWKENLNILERMDIQKTEYADVNNLSQKLSSSLYLMLLKIS